MGEYGDFALPFCCEKKRNAVNSTFLLLFTNAADRNRTGTGITTHGILSPGRLPVPPLRQEMLKRFLRKAYVLCTVFSTSHQWAEVDSNHRSKLQQIYSLSPLATRESTHFVSRQYLFIS